MYLRAGDGGIALLFCPVFKVDSLGCLQIDRDDVVDLVSEVNIPTCSLSVEHRDREGVEHIVLIKVEAVVVILSIEQLGSGLQSDGCVDKMIVGTLSDYDAKRG